MAAHAAPAGLPAAAAAHHDAQDDGSSSSVYDPTNSVVVEMRVVPATVEERLGVTWQFDECRFPLVHRI
eukprot:gene2509-8565_t